MRVTVDKSKVSGRVRVPPSKSQTIRGLMCAALARGESEIIDPLICEDTDAAVRVLRQVGIRIQQEPGRWRVTGGIFQAPSADLFCGESATTLRFMTAVCSLVPGTCRLVGGPSLSGRPVKSLTEALRMLGVKCSIEGKTTPPVVVEGGTLQGGLTELPGNISSQFVSALLLVAPFAEKEVSIQLATELTSRHYVLMTLKCLKKFGINVGARFDKFVVARQRYQPARFEVEGDWSSASYLLALGAISGAVEAENLSTTSLQGDRVVLDLLRRMGARVRVAGDTVAVSKSALKAIPADFDDCIDLLPTMAVLAAVADGTSEFTGIGRARIKESNRVAAVRERLEKMGVPVVEGGGRLTITGLATRRQTADGENEESKPGGAAGAVAPPAITIDSVGDHRIAMAFGVLGTAVGGLTIDGAECVAKTFPQFWEMLRGVGAKVVLNV
jgi:3-phosphoshikimate 1-carboxyvinyltransferase